MTSNFSDRWSFKATAGALAVLVAASTLGGFGCASRKQYAINEAILISERRQLEDEIYRMQFELRDALAENERLRTELDGGGKTPKASGARVDSNRRNAPNRNSASTVDASRYPGGDALRVATPTDPNLARTPSAPTVPTEIVDESAAERSSADSEVAGAFGAPETELYFPNAGYEDVKLERSEESGSGVGGASEGEIEQLPDFVPIPVSAARRDSNATSSGTPENLASTAQVRRTTQNNRAASATASGKIPGARRAISTQNARYESPSQPSQAAQTVQTPRRLKSTKVVAASASVKADAKGNAGVERTSWQSASEKPSTTTRKAAKTAKSKSASASTSTIKSAESVDDASEWSPLSE